MSSKSAIESLSDELRRRAAEHFARRIEMLVALGFKASQQGWQVVRLEQEGGFAGTEVRGLQVMLTVPRARLRLRWRWSLTI